MNQPVHRFSAEELLKVLLLSENATAVYTTDNLIIEMANNAMLHIWHKTPDVAGQSLAEVLPELEGQPFIGLLQNVWRTGQTYEARNTPAQLLVNGVLQTFYFNFTYRAIKNSSGQVYAILHTATDVTSEVENQAALEKAKHHEIAYINEQALNEELAALNEELRASNEELIQSQQNLATLNNELEARVTARTNALATSEARARYMLSGAPVAIAILTGPQLKIETANDAMLKIWDKTTAVINKPILQALPELEGQPYPQILADVFAKGEPFYGNEAKVLLERNGVLEEGYYNFVNYPLTDTQGIIESIVVIANDVTEQVEARSEIENLYEQSRLSKQAADLGTFDLDLPKGTMEWDARCRELFGISHTGIVTYEQDFLPGLHPGDRQRISRIIDDAFVKAKTNGDYDVEYRTVGVENGQVRWVRAKGKVLFDEADQPVRFIGSVLDVTQQVTARQQLEQTITEKTALENSLRINEQRLQSILDTMAEGVCIVDLNGRNIYANQMAQKILGLTESQIKKCTYSDPNWQYLNIHGLPLSEAERPMIKMLAAGKPLYDQEIAIQPAGRERFYIAINAAPLFDQQGNLTGGVGTFTDVTARRKDVQQKDDFISIASHELKTPVTSLKASLQLLDKMKDQPSPVLLPKLINQCNKSVAKITSLIDELLSASQVTQGLLQLDKTTFTIAEMINSCCNHVRMAGTHELVLQGDEELKVYADEHRIDQVVVNLVNNAVKYAPESKEIYLIVEKLDDVAKVSVKDSGPGIASEKLPHLFERYYRATESGGQYGGLGLGLYISSEIIKKHGGQIGVDSELGQGSTFWFTLPLE